MKLHITAFCLMLASTLSTAWAARSEFTVSVLTTASTSLTGQTVTNTPGEPGRSLVLTLTSTESALPGAMAEVWLPENLKLGKKASLDISSADTRTAAKDLPVNPESIKMKIYWGSSPAIQQGQPKTLTWQDFPDSVKRAMKPDGGPVKGSVAKWTADAAKLGPKGGVVGEYRLMSYAGAAAIFLDTAQDFLPPVEVTSTDGDKGVGPIQVSWKPVQGALAYFVSAHGVGSDGSIIGWTSGPGADAAKRAELEGCLPDKQRQNLIRKHILLGPDVTQCTIPANIFGGADAAMIIVTAYGSDKENPGRRITARAVVRSTASVVKDFRTPGNPAASASSRPQ